MLIRILRSISVAFSMYSRIPMPRFEWGSRDMEYHLCFFPWVGAAIGLMEYLWLIICDTCTLDRIPQVLIAMAIPLLITGGFHVDGYMDTSDAMSSWRTRPERLDILKDPHIGAFAVIRLAELGLLYAAALFLLDGNALILWIGTFFLSRCLSGIAVVTLAPARQGGLLATEAKTAAPRIVRIALIIQALAVAAGMFALAPRPAAALLLVSLASLAAYRAFAYRYFGGVTGDLAGWYLCVTELAMTITLAVTTLLGLN